MHGKVIRVGDDRVFAILSPGRTIQVETVHPDSLSTQKNASILFIERLCGDRAVQVNVLCDPDFKLGNKCITSKVSRVPYSYAKIDPASFFVPPLGRNWVELYEKISCGHLFILGPGYECRSSGELGVLH